MLLILGNNDFHQVNYVKQKLDARQIEYLAIDFNQKEAITFEIDNDGERYFYHDVELSQFPLMWRTSKFLYPRFGDNQEWADKYIASSMQKENYRNFLAVFPGKIVNAFEVNLLGLHKLRQLKLARAVGLKIPNSIVTNSLAKLDEWRNGSTTLITKCLGEPYIPVIEDGVKQQLITTSKLDCSYLEDNHDNIEPFQVYVQINVAKRYEHRCVYVGGRIFNFRIDPNQHPIMETDYRIGGEMVEYVPYELPTPIQHKICEYSRIANLFSACFDLIENTQGEFIFLEVNPEGVWGKHDDILQGAISTCFADALVTQLQLLRN
jgi:hypothetical protein